MKHYLRFAPVPLILLLAAPVAHAGPCFDQPNMANALQQLKAARASLDKAEHNRDGWRVAAIEAVNKAIAETERGCAMADK